MLQLLLLSFLIPFITAVILIPSLVKLANEKRLFDVPDARKVHQNPIPSLGGIAMFSGFFMAVIAISDSEFLAQWRYVLVGSFLLFLIGLKDDLVGVSPSKRLLGQLLVGSLCYVSGFQLEGFYGLFGVYELPTVISFLLTIVTIALIINAFNLIDGINGLAGSLGIFSSVLFGWLFWKAGLTDWTVIAVALVGAIVGFLKYNFGKASIFMGDNGSTFIGLMVAVFFLKYLNLSFYEWGNNHALVVGLAVIFIPVFDLLRVFSLRILNGNSPFNPDKTHLHHYFLSMGRNHSKAVYSILLMQGAAVVLGLFFSKNYGVTVGLMATVLVEVLMVIALTLSIHFTRIKNIETQRRLVSWYE